MTHHTDILGRAPIMRPPLEADLELPAGDDWKGKHLLHIGRSASGGGNYRLLGAALDRFNRRVQVKRLHELGKSETDIAAAVGCSQTCVIKDLKLAGLK